MDRIQRLLRYARPYRGSIALATLCMAGVAVLSTVSLASLQPVFDLLFSSNPEAVTQRLPAPVKTLLGETLPALTDFARQHKMTFLTYMCVFLLGVVLLRSLLDYNEMVIMTGVVEKVKADVREQVYAHTQGLSLRFFSKSHTGEMMSRLTFDVDLLGGAVQHILGDALRQPLSIVAFASLLCVIKWKMAVIVLLGVPLAAYPVLRLGRRVRSRSRRVQAKRAELNTLMEQTLSGIRIVKAFGTEAHEQGRFRRSSREALRHTMRIVRVDALASPMLEVLAYLGIAAAVWIGGWLVIRKVLSPGELTVYLLALASLFQPLRKLASFNINLQKAMAGVDRVFHLLDIAPEVVDRPGARPLPRMREGITFEEVTFAYEDDGRPVLKGVSFGAKMSEIVAVVGSTGAGKTTLVNLLPRFYDPTGGRITIDGHDLRDVATASLRGQMGIVTQETILFDDTIYENIAYGRKAVTPEAVRRAADVANALEFIDRLPDGFETRIGERGVRLSGGQRQRIALARAILMDPPILILDEATSALDAESERQVQEALERSMRNRTTFVVAHRLSTIMRADKILVLERSRLAEIGTHAELMALRGTYWRLYQSQFAEFD
ncbi:MAG TPA: ABC transporter ATP-binding protein [Candidatus Methylomirabilis sp.]|jgi:subfamily B ATP-binding cassette protein MsbA